MTNHIHEYFKSICEANGLGNIESSYYRPICSLLEKFDCKALDVSGGRSKGKDENIDIELWHGETDIDEKPPFAGVEVKRIGADDKERKQTKGAANYYGNAIYTDNLRWEFWHANEEKMYAGVQLIEFANNEFVLHEERFDLFISLVEDFMLKDPTQIKSSNKLAEYMAIHAKTIREVIAGILKEDENKQPLVDDRQKILPMFSELYGLYIRIREDLRPHLDTRKFADMYAQTIVYGLFIARYNDANSTTFNRYEAIGKLQEESALLNRFFSHITSSGKKHPTLDAVIDKLCALYQICNISDLLACDKRGNTIVHFYEDFLTHYDPALRKSLGVFYTPHQVVRYLVSMVDKLLVEDFGIEKGLANNETFQITVPSEPYKESDRKNAKTLDTKQITVPRVAILDPACGTGTFHAETIKYIKDTYFSGGRAAFYDDYMRNENGLLSRMIGFEIMMTSYVVAHLNVRRVIEETLGHESDKQLPTNIFLTNTLAPPNSDLEQTEQLSLFDFSAAITEEARNADKWKTRRPIKVIIGNPPYLRGSKNPFDVSTYRTEADGVTPLGERKHALDDDYVKFFRFAEQIISKNDEGVLAFVSNNGYLDNQTFRGMRASLLRTFDKIYIVDLHGSTNKQETALDGSKDENIFDIMQGVCLFIGVKKKSNTDWAKVYHCDLWGKREQKFNSLDEFELNFSKLELDHKMAYFIPFGSADKAIYGKSVSITELFTVFVSGVQTNNDEAAISPTKEELNRRIDIVKNAVDETVIKDLWGKFSSGQTAEKIQTDVLSPEGVATSISFRPFDERWTYYSGMSCGWIHRPREKKSMGHLLKSNDCPINENVGLVFGKTSRSFFSPFISKTIIGHRLFSAMSDYTFISPLYRRVETLDTAEWEPNFDNDTLARLTQHLSSPPSPIEVFDYIYGILHDPVYIERFNDYLCRDFPRVPIINAPKESDNDFHVSEEKFRAYVSAGERLRKLHLMQEKVSAELGLNGQNLEIDKIKYKDGALNINADTQITGIPEDVWAYRIGGYQVLDKWFKSHKSEVLTVDRYDHICNVVGLLGEVIKVQEELKGLHQ